MPKINLSHFEAAFIFALFTSVVMGITSKKTQSERVRYGAQCFGYFMLALFGIGWAMKLGHG
jgi:putative Mn2+ efflux pump MntP